MIETIKNSYVALAISTGVFSDREIKILDEVLSKSILVRDEDVDAEIPEDVYIIF